MEASPDPPVWRNWARTGQAAPARWCLARREAAISAAVKDAASARATVPAAGRVRSLTAAAATSRVARHRPAVGGGRAPARGRGGAAGRVDEIPGQLGGRAAARDQVEFYGFPDGGQAVARGTNGWRGGGTAVSVPPVMPRWRRFWEF